MEPVIWVEVLSRQRDVVARHRVVSGELRVGRAYDNEVVVDDPHVAGTHLRIWRDAAGALIAEDLGSLNGLYRDGGTTRQERLQLDGESAIRIGQTWLRVREADHPVPPERPVTVERRLWPYGPVLAGAILGIEALGVWLNETQEPKAAAFLGPILTVSESAVAWIAAWTVLSRVFAGAARFERHLVLALAALLTYSLFDEVTSLLAFGLSWPALVTYRYVVYWLMVGATAYGHLLIIGPGRKRLKAAGALALCLVAITYVAVDQATRRAAVDEPDPIRRFYPPVFRLTAPETTDRFLDDTKSIRGRLDGAREDGGR